MQKYILVFVLTFAITSQLSMASVTVQYSSWKDLYTAIASEVLDQPDQDAIFELGLKSTGTFHPLADERVIIILRLGYHEGFVTKPDPVRNEPRLVYKNPRFCSKSDLDCLIYVVTYEKATFQIVNRFHGSIVKFVRQSDPLKVKLYERRGDNEGKDVCYEWSKNAFKESPCIN